MKLNYYWIILLGSAMCFGQDRAEFTRGKEFYLKGNAAVIGNSILGKSASGTLNNPKKSNDEYKMRYIDIDRNSETWSSSSAYFSIPKEATLVNATLYWTAIYNGESSGVRLKNHRPIFKKLENRQHDPQAIKIKPPSRDYIDIYGELIYDGKIAKDKAIKSRAPYAYQADVTDILKGSNEGDITVANVSATQGKMFGGSSAGWLLYLVYEDDSQPYQYITTYYGLESIKRKVVEIDFGNFNSSEKGEQSTYITVGALEGDSNVGKDQVKIYNPESDLFKPFGSSLRSANNFFNSTITLQDKEVLTRKPKSTNTLGFDIAQIKIDNELNTILANSPQGIRMQFDTEGDEFFLFFTAFQTTISESLYEERTAIIAETEIEQETKVETPVTPVIEKLLPKETVVVSPAPVVKKIQEPTIVTNTTVQSNHSYDRILTKIVNSSSAQVPYVRGGFYIISNVFANPENAKKWEETLRTKGYATDTFFRPEKGYHYVSIGNNTDPLIMYDLLKRVRSDKDLRKSWILKVNM